MPHCLLEYSNNIVEPLDLDVLFQEAHTFLAGTGLFALGDIKSRVVRPDRFRVGDGASVRAFVAMTVSILDGRDDDVKRTISRGLHSLVQRHVQASTAGLRCSVTVQIIEMQRCCYVRGVSPP